MVEKKQRSEGFDQFLANYNAADVPNSDKPINSSQYDLKEQLERFSNFSHTKDESETILKEAHVL